MICNEDKARMSELAETLFEGHHVGIYPDPEDDGIGYVTVYGIPDGEVRSAKEKLWDAIEGLSGEMDIAPFVPSIVSLSNTQRFYPAFMPNTPDDDVAIPAPVLAAIEQGAPPGIHRIEYPLRENKWPGWSPQRPSIVWNIANREETSDVRAIRFAA